MGRLPRQAQRHGPTHPPPARPIDSQAPRTSGHPSLPTQGRGEGPTEAGGARDRRAGTPAPQPNFLDPTRARAVHSAPLRPPTAQVRSRPSAEPGPAPRHRAPARAPTLSRAAGSPRGPAARQPGRGGCVGPAQACRPWDGRGRPVLPGTRPRARASPGPRPPLTGAGARLPDFQQQDDDGRQVGQVPGQPENVHGGGGGLRGGPRLGGSGSGGGGPRKEAAKMARAGATWPGTWPNCRRARRAAWESGRRPGPAPAPPLKGDAPRAGRARAQLPGSIRGSLTPCQLTPAGFPASSGVPASSFNF